MKVYSIHIWDECDNENELLDIKGSITEAREVLQKAIYTDDNFEKTEPEQEYIETWRAGDYGVAGIKEWEIKGD